MKIPLVGLGLIAAVLIGAKLSAPQTTQKEDIPLSGTDWINGKAKSFKGRVTVLHFWTFACINCKHNLSYYSRWAGKYDPSEVQVVGVHTPELEIEKDPKNVRDAVKRLGILYPVVIDAKADNWNRYGVQYWPTIFLIDKKGSIRRKWEGELQWNGADGFGDLSAEIEKLRKEKG